MPWQRAPSGESFTLTLRKTRPRRSVAGHDPEDDYSIVDGGIRVGRIYKMTIQGEEKWCWFLQASVPEPNCGTAGTLEDCTTDFKRRYAEVRDAHGSGAGSPKDPAPPPPRTPPPHPRRRRPNPHQPIR